MFIRYMYCRRFVKSEFIIHFYSDAFTKVKFVFLASFWNRIGENQLKNFGFKTKYKRIDKNKNYVMFDPFIVFF